MESKGRVRRKPKAVARKRETRRKEGEEGKTKGSKQKRRSS